MIEFNITKFGDILTDEETVAFKEVIDMVEKHPQDVAKVNTVKMARLLARSYVNY